MRIIANKNDTKLLPVCYIAVLYLHHLILGYRVTLVMFKGFFLSVNIVVSSFKSNHGHMQIYNTLNNTCYTCYKVCEIIY